MTNIIYLSLLPVVATALVAAQSLWRNAVVKDAIFKGKLGDILSHTVTNPKMWLGGILYIATTVLYLFLFSKLKFFVVQITVTGLALMLSTAISHYIFHEDISVLNLLGLLMVLIGIGLVVQR